jgi:hypothetical protein
MLSVESSHVRHGEQFDPEVCWALLERVAASPHLRRATRLRELLLYVGQRSLREGCDHVPEHEIGVKVFGRSETYDNANDSIVRTTISDLRKRVDAYFAAEGLDEPIVMEIPRGAYIPVFYSRDAQLEEAEDLTLEAAPEPIHAPDGDRSKALRSDRVFRWVASSAIVILLCVSIILWYQNHEAQRALHPWRNNPVLSSIWSSFLDSDRDTDIVMEDSSVLLLQLISKHDIELSDYINKTFLEQPPIQEDNSVASRSLLLVSRKALGKASDFRVSLAIRLLDPQNPKLHFYNAREYTPRLLQNDNVILLGNPTSNPWDQWFENSLNFAEMPHTTGTSPVINRSPRAGESATYTSQENSDGGKAVAHCVIAYLPKPDHSGNMLLIQGTTSEATEAGGQYLLSEAHMADFARQLHVKKLPYFEVLLHVSQVLGSPMTATIEAYRTYPNLHL